MRLRIGAFALLLLTAGCAANAPLPPKAVDLNRAGIDALEQGDLETADARFTLALEYSPKFVDALVNLALVEMQRGNFGRARQLLERARRLNPDVAQPHHGLGVLAEREHRPDRASAHYAEALRVDPGFAPARANLARLLFEAGMFEHARGQFKRLVEVAPEEPLGYSGLAEALLRLGRIEEAEAVVATGVERFPDRAELLILAARSLIRRGQFEQAIIDLEPLSRPRNDSAAAALGWMATAELASGRPEQAASTAERAIRLDPHQPVAVYALALALHETRAPHARAWLERASALAPGDATLAQALETSRTPGRGGRQVRP